MDLIGRAARWAWAGESARHPNETNRDVRRIKEWRTESHSFLVRPSSLSSSSSLLSWFFLLNLFLWSLVPECRDLSCINSQNHRLNYKSSSVILELFNSVLYCCSIRNLHQRGIVSEGRHRQLPHVGLGRLERHRRLIAGDGIDQGDLINCMGRFWSENNKKDIEVLTQTRFFWNLYISPSFNYSTKIYLRDVEWTDLGRPQFIPDLSKKAKALVLIFVACQKQLKYNFQVPWRRLILNFFTKYRHLKSVVGIDWKERLFHSTEASRITSGDDETLRDFPLMSKSSWRFFLVYKFF